MPILIDPKGVSIGALKPAVVIDAILAKRNLGTRRDMAPLTIALGPGFTAGEDVDVVVETKRGHRLGRIIREGAAIPNTGIPGVIGGYGAERVIHAQAAGIFKNVRVIGDIVEAGDTIAAWLPWDSEYDDADLQIDVSLEDGETIELGDHTIYAFATIGHTKCSMSYLIDDELMLCSETVGVMGHDGSYMPSFLVDYKAAEESIEYSSELDAKEIILNHYGFVSEADKATIWDVLMQKLRDSRDAMIDIMNRFPEEETALREMERVFHSHVDKKEQPDEAFYINAASMMKTLKRQFPERFPRHFQLIAAVDRNWGIGNKGQMLTVIPADQKLFRQETMGKIIVMGYKTFLTFPAQRPLDGRINLILTKKKALSVKGAEICHSVEEALVRIDELKQEKHLTDVDVVIIGGESVYRQFLPFCDTAQITWIDFSYVADTHMVDLEKEGWELVRRSGEQTFFNFCYEFREYRKLEKESL